MPYTKKQLEGLLRRAKKEIDRCHKRLEIDHWWRMGTKKMIREHIPYKDRRRVPDGISCRDETIKLLERRIERLKNRAP